MTSSILDFNSLKDFTFHNNTHLLVLKYLRTYTRNLPIPLITGPTGIGKSSVLNTIFRQLKLSVIDLSFSLDYKEILINTPALDVFNRPTLFFIDGVDFNDKDFSFIDYIFTHSKKIKPIILFCCCDVYKSYLFKYRKTCKIFNLSLTRVDIEYVIGNVFKNKVSDKLLNEMLETYDTDLRTIITNVKLRFLGKRINNSKVSPLGLHKTVNAIFRSNLKYISRNTHFYSYLEMIADEYGNRLFELCYENFPINCQMFNNLSAIVDVNSMISTFPKKYLLIFTDMINKYCRDNENKKIINFMFLRSKNCNIRNLLHERLTKYKGGVNNLESKYYRMIDYWTLSHLRNLMTTNERSKTVQMIVWELLEVLPSLDVYLDKERCLRILDQKRVETVCKPIIVNKKFKLRFKDGISKGARMNVGIYDLFK